MSALGAVAAFLSALTWAVGSGAYARLTREYSPLRLAMSRALAAIPLFAIAGVLIEGGVMGYVSALRAVGARETAWYFYSMIATYGLGDTCFLLATRGLGVPGALAIASIYPLWTTLGELVLHGRLPPPLQWIGMLVVVAGTIWVILSAPTVETDTTLSTSARPRSSSRARAVWLALGASIFWASNSVAIAAVGNSVGAVVGNSIRMLSALVICLVLGALSEGWQFVRRPALPGSVFLANYWVFAVEAFGGAFLYVYGLSNAPLLVSVTLASLAPVLVVPIAWAMRLERLELRRVAAVALTVAGLILLVRGGATGANS